MIVGKLKPVEEIVSSISEFKNILILGARIIAKHGSDELFKVAGQATVLP